MKHVINLPRVAVRNWAIDAPKNTIWISISEPDSLNSVVSNEELDKLPKLSLSFWDLTSPAEHNGEMLYPPSDSVAKTIVDFILSHPDQNILVNCAAGVSRSGAVAQFCEDFLGYHWLAQGKQCAMPNHVLYGLMRDYYKSTERIEKHSKTVKSAYEIALDKIQEKS